VQRASSAKSAGCSTATSARAHARTHNFPVIRVPTRHSELMQSHGASG
jgi:hypothetical protein